MALLRMSPDTVHPLEAMMTPITADPMEQYERMQAAQPMARPVNQGLGGENEPGHAVQMSPLDPYEEALRTKQMSDIRKDQNPYGSMDNHPGVLGRILHGLSVATGGPNRRQFAEEGREKQIAGIESEKSKNALEGAQAANAQATAGKTNAETPEVAPNAESTRSLQGAEAGRANAQTQALENPPSQFEIHDTAIGPLFINKQTGQAQHLSVDGQPVGPKLALKESQPIMGEDGKPHTYMIDDQGRKVVDLGVHYERPITVNAGSERAEKNDLLKAYQPSLDSAERMNVMTDAYEKAVKDHDQQAMLNLLANHLGMTMGLQKGARMTRDIIREAQQSMPWLQGIQARFDKDGYLSGVVLSPQQMRQMVQLGQERYAEDAKKSRATAQYLGSSDDGPARVPGEATIRYYKALAGGNGAKAKQLAAADGWTVE